MSVGVPIKLLHESENHIVTIEIKTGELFRGYLTEAEVTNPCLQTITLLSGYNELQIG